MAFPPPMGVPPPPPVPGKNSAAAVALGIPPPPKVAPPPSSLPSFEFTNEDVQAAVDDLLEGLPPVQVVEKVGRPQHAIAVVGPKGGKTVASIAVKTPKCQGLPRPNGSIAVVIHVDNQARGSFENFLFEQNMELEAGEVPTFIPLGQPHKRYKARVSQSDPACSSYVKDVVLEIMRRLGARGDVGLFVFDGYGDYANRYGNYVAAYANGVSSPLKLDGTMWTVRREFYTDNISGGLGAVCMGGWYVINGPSGGLEAEMEKDPSKLKKRMRKEGWGERQPPAKWLLYRENMENVSAVIETDVAIDLTSDTPKGRYLCDVWDGRASRFGFTTGREMDITGQNIGALVPPSTQPSSNHKETTP